MIPEIVRIPYPLCGIRFIILTDGTVYENCLYECNKILKKEEYDVIFDHMLHLFRFSRESNIDEYSNNNFLCILIFCGHCNSPFVSTILYHFLFPVHFFSIHSYYNEQ